MTDAKHNVFSLLQLQHAKISALVYCTILYDLTVVTCAVTCISLSQRKQPGFLYGSDCWAVLKTDARKIDAFDHWYLRMLLGIKMAPKVESCGCEPLRIKMGKKPKFHVRV